MLSLESRLQDSFTVNNRNYEIETDFRKWLSFEKLLDDGKTAEASGFLLSLCKPSPCNEDVEQVCKLLLDFYVNSDKKPDSEDDKQTVKTAPSFSFLEDASRIYASFHKVYGIDLQRVELHWHSFLSLLFGLISNNPELSSFTEAVYYRGVSLKGIKGDERKRYERMKKLFALKQERPTMALSKEERDKAFAEKYTKKMEESWG